MAADIYQEDLDFIQEAKTAFEAEPRMCTYTNKEANLIALRYGMGNDCMRIYRLGEELMFLSNIMKSIPVETVVKKGYEQ